MICRSEASHNLFTKSSPLEAVFRLKVIQAHGQPILMLNRDRNPELPEGQTAFTANGVVYTGNFAKIALNVTHRTGSGAISWPTLLRSWFGADAVQPGTVQYVELVPVSRTGRCGPHPRSPAAPSLSAYSASKPLRMAVGT